IGSPAASIAASSRSVSTRLAAASRIAVSGSSGRLDVFADIRQTYLTMIIHSDDAPTFAHGGTTATGYASPSRGARDLSLWRVELAPHEASPPHTLTREEVFLALDGEAIATLDGADHPLAAGDCLVVPAGVPFTLTAGARGLSAVCAMAAGGEATILPDGPTMTPPWAV